MEQRLPIAVVALEGELTLSEVSRLRHSLLRCLAECPDALIVDLQGVSGSGELALAVFRAVRRRASTWPAVPVLLCSPLAGVATKLARAGLDRILPVYRTRAAALAATTAAPSIARADHDFVPSVHTPTRARSLIAEICHAWDLKEVTEQAQLIVSELVTNAVRYTRGGLRLSAVLRTGQLHLIVRDQSPAPPRLRAAPGGPVTRHGHGHGLRLVEMLADSWGYLANGAGKAVWARLRVTPARRPDPPPPPDSARGGPAPG
jgi:anti-sigma regulatory factor (Ser/Thr protein kinase)/anti-anti-sigma regulatory factor